MRLTAGYESARAFEAAVSAAEDLSATFKKLRYATDDALGKSLCARALADAESAETALSILPFETQELEKLQGFLGRAGDYAGSLCALTERSLPAEHREHLLAFGEAAADFAAHLQELQGKLHEGSVRMDTLEKPVRNVTDGDTELLSALLLGYEGSFSSPVEFAYEGRYSPAEVPAAGSLKEDEARAVLLEGVEAGEARRLILRTLSGAYLPCWELRCTDEAGESASIYVDAETGRQYRIDL